PELAIPLPYPQLPEQNGTRSIKSYRHSHAEQERREKDQRDKRDKQIERSLLDAVHKIKRPARENNRVPVVIVADRHGTVK
ncbi:hypothetical protein MMA53_24905, partial [Salmonella enterica]|nr:hypothetical protein [Salmonella enterica]